MPSLLLLILLFSLSIEACNGRNLGFDFKVSTISSHDLSKDDVGADKISPPLKPLKGLKKINGEPNERLVEKFSSENINSVVKKKTKIEGITGEVKVSWSPTGNIKHGSKFPGFHVDYVGPRTHPPAHN